MQRTRSTLSFFVLEHGAPNVGIPHNRYSGEPRDGFLQELQPLGAELRGEAAETGDIPAGARQARDEARPNRIGAVGHHDRNCLSLLLDRRNPWIGGHDDHVHLQAYQFSGDLGQPLGLGLAEPALHHDVLTFQIPMFPQTFGERCGEM